MAKKLDNIYLKENEELETHKILVEGKNPKKNRPGKQENRVWKVLRPVVIFLIAAAVVIAGVFYGYGYIKEHYFEPVDVNDTAQVEVTIPKGASLSEISEILYENDLIRNKQIFKLYTDFSDNASKLKAGTYKLSKSMDFDDIIYTLRKSVNTSPTAQVTLPEGLTISSFAQILVDKEVQTETKDYQDICRTGEGVSVPLPLQDETVDTEDRLYLLEGYLFPDTYEFYKGAAAADVVKRQLTRFDELFTDEYYTRAAELGMSVDEVVTLASIIEKEAKADQFDKVSAVFHNRLNQDMPLQSDATIAYGLGIASRINLTTEELETPSPYNTHLNIGLPVGPICNPGIAAIRAALYPDEGYLDEGYLYFTLTDPDTGELEFSQTLEEHQAIVDQWKSSWDAWDAEHMG